MFGEKQQKITRDICFLRNLRVRLEFWQWPPLQHPNQALNNSMPGLEQEPLLKKGQYRGFETQISSEVQFLFLLGT